MPPLKHNTGNRQAAAKKRAAVTIPLPRGTVDLTGQTFGDLDVQEYAGRDEAGGHALWRCLCHCPAEPKPHEKIARGTRLRQGRQVSCGGRRADPEVRKAAWATRRANP